MGDIHTTEAIHIEGDLHARDIVQHITIKTPAPPPKNIRFKVEKPIQTFIGRETFLEELHKVVKDGQCGGQGGVTVLTQEPLSVVAATGGIGKTETVRRYIQLHGHEYDHIIWIDAEDASASRSQFVDLAMRLKISTDFEGKPKEFNLILTEIFEKLLLNAHVVLLVFDNAEAWDDEQELNLSGIKSLRPTSLSPFFVEPTIIVTSRNQNWGIYNVIPLGLWTEAEVVLFVMGRLRLEKTSENKTLALKLGSLFGRLPIALQAAVAVILQQIKRKKTYGIERLIDEYDNGCRKVLAQKPSDANMRPTHMSDTMLVLWNISFEKIVKFEDGKLAIKILCFMAYMSHTRIPQDFLSALFKNSSTEDSFENAIEILEDYSLITSLSSDDSASSSFSIHRMIQDATIENLRTRTNEGQMPNVIFNETTFLNETEVLLKLSAESVNYTGAIPGIAYNGELVRNLVQIASHVSEKLDVKEFRDLTEITAQVLRVTNNFPNSIELFKKVLKANPSRNGIEIATNLELKRALALTYVESGQFQKSLDLYLEVLEVHSLALGQHHEHTLDTKSQVAGILHAMGKQDEAYAKYMEVFQGYKNNKDTQSAGFLLTKVNFAGLLFDKGWKKTALELLTQVLNVQEKDPVSNSRSIIATKLNIALKLTHEGHLEKASKILLQNIEDATKLLGPSHLLTLSCRRAYASTLHRQKKYDLAAPLLLELIKIEETLVGTDHRSTIETKLVLGAVYLETKELDKAEALLDVEVIERVLGPKDSLIFKVATFLASLKEEQGNFQDAVALRYKMVIFSNNVLLPNRKDILAVLHNIVVLHYETGEFAKAAEVAQEYLERQKEAFGEDHPDTIKTLNFIALCRKNIQNRNEKITCFMMSTSADAETGKFFLKASDWDLQAALKNYCNSNQSAHIADPEQATNQSDKTTDVKNLNEATISCNKTEANQTQDLGVQMQSVAESNQPNTFKVFCLESGTMRQVQFGVSSAVEGLHEFVNEKSSDLADSNYALTLDPNTELTQKEETME